MGKVKALPKDCFAARYPILYAMAEAMAYDGGAVRVAPDPSFPAKLSPSKTAQLVRAEAQADSLTKEERDAACGMSFLESDEIKVWLAGRSMISLDAILDDLHDGDLTGCMLFDFPKPKPKRRTR